MKKIIVFLLLTYLVSAIAEPKRLVCSSPSENELVRLKNAAEEYRNPNYIAHNLNTAKEFDEKSRQCNGAKFGHQYTFVFDTAGLTNPAAANVEVGQIHLCGNMVNDVVMGSLEATPSIITFKVPKDRKFNIDRKTLAGGFGSERDFTCELLKVDTSKNIL